MNNSHSSSFCDRTDFEIDDPSLFCDESKLAFCNGGTINLFVNILFLELKVVVVG